MQRRKPPAVDGRGFYMESAVFAKEEQSQCAGACVRADDCAHMIDVDMLDTQLFCQNVGQILGILNAVAVTDEDGVVGTGNGGFAHFLCQHLDGGFSAPGFGDIDQMTFVIHMKHRLDLQHGAD